MREINFDPDANADSGDPTTWEPIKREPRRRPPSLVLSVRVTPEIVAGLQAIAVNLGATLSEAARLLLTDSVAAVWQQSSITVRTVEGSGTTVAYGHSSVGGSSKLRLYKDLQTAS